MTYLKRNFKTSIWACRTCFIDNPGSYYLIYRAENKRNCIIIFISQQRRKIIFCQHTWEPSKQLLIFPKLIPFNEQYFLHTWNANIVICTLWIDLGNSSASYQGGWAVDGESISNIATDLNWQHFSIVIILEIWSKV